MNNNLLTGVVSFNIIIPRTINDLPAYVDVRLNRLDSDSTRNTFSASLNSKDNSIILNDYPQDVDDCLLNIDKCEQICSDGWYPIGSYTCDCNPGYKLDEINKRNCTVICGDGLLKYPDEQCDPAFSLYGCNFDCTAKPNYNCDSTGCSPICGDNIISVPEECDNTSPGCTNCKVTKDYTCDDQNICQPCSQNWEPFIYPNNLLLFPKIRALGYNLSDFSFVSCLTCNDGISLETREVSSSKYCNSVSSQQSTQCSFACSNLTIFSSADESIFTLKQELEKGGGFLNQIFNILFNTNITITINKKRDGSSQLDFNITSCNQNISQMLNVIQALVLDITPNIPQLQLNTGNCSIGVSATDPPSSSQFIPGIIIGIVVGAVFLLIVSILSILIFKYYRSEVHLLPKEIAWSFVDYLRYPWKWSWNGNNKTGYYSRTYDPQSNEYKKIMDLLSTYFKKGSIIPLEIKAVYNHTLLVSFINQWKIMMSRKKDSPELFFECGFRKNAEKMAIMEYYQKNIIDKMSYNKDLLLPLIPVLHGTDELIAEKICDSGYCSLSSLDSGFYGKGIYFTSSLKYCLPYCCMKRRPALLLNYINPGNIFAVNEDHKGPNSLIGAATKAGYNTHYCLTNKDGTVYNKNNDTICDEFIVSQESQIIVSHIITLDAESCVTHFNEWQRVTPQPVHDAALKYRETSTISEIKLEYTSATIIDISETI
jgi:hypothetical protein